MILEFYAEYSTLIDTVLAIALAATVWVAYRELRRRKSSGDETSQMPKSSAV